jgi:hypothetical protein
MCSLSGTPPRRATHRTFPDESAHGMEGRRYSANGPADRQSKEGTSSSGSTRSRNARSTKVVRSRAVADPAAKSCRGCRRNIPAPMSARALSCRSPLSSHLCEPSRVVAGPFSPEKAGRALSRRSRQDRPPQEARSSRAQRAGRRVARARPSRWRRRPPRRGVDAGGRLASEAGVTRPAV